MANNPEYNREQRPINQAQGPRMGNQNLHKTKREEFLREKTAGFRTELAEEVMRALEARDPGDYIDPRVEPLNANRGPKHNPTAGGTDYNVRKPAARKITR
jgi:hypothetical protein